MRLLVNDTESRVFYELICHNCEVFTGNTGKKHNNNGLFERNL